MQLPPIVWHHSDIRLLPLNVDSLHITICLQSLINQETLILILGSHIICLLFLLFIKPSAEVIV